ncbi:MAG: hypothetical protein GEV28_30190 [Actinophytocola sp.]|uniref:recombinase family protein n=1 Tax=Actinophytocola sp. TaxID=1872138 RepID=UPI0013248809|nr:recombinase family protein [Actinophytocola sp.]MPZ84429.1 hypothetical protein [Actinophytocola sp.]
MDATTPGRRPSKEDDRLQAGCYARQSHGKQVSIEDQIREAHETCGREGWVPLDYGDTVSASRFGTRERGGWSELVVDVTAGKLDIVVLWDSSRGDRTPSTWAFFLERCRKHAVRIHVIRDQRSYDLAIPRDWKILHDSGTDAAYESEIKSVDVLRGVAGAALAGKAHGRAAHGYTRRYDPDDRKIFTEVPNDDAVVVREIIERIAREDPLIAIMRDLHARGITAPGGGPWRRNMIKKLVHPRYIGKRSHNGVLHDANWPPLVDEVTFYRAQSVLSAPGRRQAAPGATKHLLSYIVLAQGCEQGGRLAMQGRADRARRYKCDADSCLSIGADELEAFVTELVMHRLARPDARQVFARGDEAARVAEVEVARLDLQLREARVSFADPDGGISADALAMKERHTMPLLEAARQRQAEASHSGALLALVGDGEFTVEVGRPRWKRLSVAARRSVIKTLFAKIEVGRPTRRLTRWSTGDERMEEAVRRTAIEWA